MNRALLLLVAILVLEAPSAAWSDTQSLPARPLAAAPDSNAFLLQADTDAAPEWAVQTHLTVAIAEFDPKVPLRTYALPDGTTLFDVRDANGDGMPDLAAIRGTSLCYWRSLETAATTNPDVCIEDGHAAALDFGLPRPAPLFAKQRGINVLKLPGWNRMWRLSGQAVPRTAPQAPEVDYHLDYFRVVPTAPTGVAGAIPRAFRFSQVYEQSLPPPRPAETVVNSETASPGGTRRARDAAEAPPGAWPWFPLNGQPTSTTRVLYALAPPEYRDTIVRFRPPASAEPAGPGDAVYVSPERRYPGVLIAPHGAPPDFNGDGFADLLLWNVELPGRSLGSIARAAQSGAWKVTMTVHLYNPPDERYNARPNAVTRMNAPIDTVLGGGVNGPFHHLLLRDVDGDRDTDLVTTGSGNSLDVYLYQGTLPPAPTYRAKFHDPVAGILVDAPVPGGGWVAILRTTAAFYGVALPKK